MVSLGRIDAAAGLEFAETDPCIRIADEPLE